MDLKGTAVVPRKRQGMEEDPVRRPENLDRYLVVGPAALQGNRIPPGDEAGGNFEPPLHEPLDAGQVHDLAQPRDLRGVYPEDRVNDEAQAPDLPGDGEGFFEDREEILPL